jgi:hypothetical protein
MRATYLPTLTAAIATARARGYSDGRYSRPANPDTVCLLGPAVLASYRAGYAAGVATLTQPLTNAA